MSRRAEALHAIADEQLAELAALIATLDQVTLRLPCPGREKLGDGTVGACAHHTVENYQRIASFVETRDRMASAHAHPGHGHGHGPRDALYRTEDLEPAALAGGLADARRRTQQIFTLTDGQLDTAPPAGSFRFCDGQRTLEQVLAGLLTHQAHQIGAIRAALTTDR